MALSSLSLHERSSLGPQAKGANPSVQGCILVPFFGGKPSLCHSISWFPKQDIHSQASDKLMNGIDGEKLDNSLKFRSYKEEDAARRFGLLCLGLPRPPLQPDHKR